MPVQVPANALPLTTDDIRAFLRDQPKYNILIEGVEFSDKDIQRAIRFTVSKWNALTPQSTDPTTGETLNEYMLLCGVAAILLRSEGIRQVRNQVTYQDGNMPQVSLDEKEAIYMRWADRMQQEFDFHARNIKTQNNMESCYGGLSSGYRYIGRWTV
jgi:hypothetical protein